MDVDYINPFIKSSISVISQVTSFHPVLGNVFVKQDPYVSNNVLVIIGLTGKIKGSAVITLNSDVACKITSSMMGGAPVLQLDDIAKSAISELCNMILGNTATLFSQKGIHVDITPPTILTGLNMQISVHKSVVVCIPLLLDETSKMDIQISYTDT